MDDYQNILNEYLDPSTSLRRKKEIKRAILESENEDDKILLGLQDSIISEPSMQAFQERLQNLEGKKNRWTPLRIAASISLLILASVAAYLLLLQDNQKPKKAFQAYFTPYDGYISTRGSEGSYSDGIQAYESERYQEALDLFLSLEPDSTRSVQHNLLISSCYLTLEDPKSALSYLRQIDDHQTKLIISNRDWYQSLSYLSMGELDKSKRLLQELVRKKTPFATKASELLNESVFSD